MTKLLLFLTVATGIFALQSCNQASQYTSKGAPSSIQEVVDTTATGGNSANQRIRGTTSGAGQKNDQQPMAANEVIERVETLPATSFDGSFVEGGGEKGYAFNRNVVTKVVAEMTWVIRESLPLMRRSGTDMEILAYLDLFTKQEKIMKRCAAGLYHEKEFYQAAVRNLAGIEYVTKKLLTIRSQARGTLIITQLEQGNPNGLAPGDIMLYGVYKGSQQWVERTRNFIPENWLPHINVETLRQEAEDYIERRENSDQWLNFHFQVRKGSFTS